jgi:hypothetical protein
VIKSFQDVETALFVRYIGGEKFEKGEWALADFLKQRSYRSYVSRATTG